MKMNAFLQRQLRLSSAGETVLPPPEKQMDAASSRKCKGHELQSCCPRHLHPGEPPCFWHCEPAACADGEAHGNTPTALPGRVTQGKISPAARTYLAGARCSLYCSQQKSFVRGPGGWGRAERGLGSDGPRGAEPQLPSGALRALRPPPLVGTTEPPAAAALPLAAAERGAGRGPGEPVPSTHPGARLRGAAAGGGRRGPAAAVLLPPPSPDGRGCARGGRAAGGAVPVRNGRSDGAHAGAEGGAAAAGGSAEPRERGAGPRRWGGWGRRGGARGRSAAGRRGRGPEPAAAGTRARGNGGSPLSPPSRCGRESLSAPLCRPQAARLLLLALDPARPRSPPLPCHFAK
nr:collagen alpha-1(III) chain-like isoform X2 [Anas platyrhynchos]